MKTILYLSSFIPFFLVCVFVQFIYLPIKWILTGKYYLTSKWLDKWFFKIIEI